MNQASKNYIPPVKMASAGGVMLNMSTVKAIKGYSQYEQQRRNTIQYIVVTYHNGSQEEFEVNGGWEWVIDDLMEQMR